MLKSLDVIIDNILLPLFYLNSNLNHYVFWLATFSMYFALSKH